jgi:tRNA-specific 2-thiouridylase
MTHSNKVVVGLSGGVDSAVSAYLLKKEGYEVSGVYLMCWKEPGCRAEGDRKDALRTAVELGIPFRVLDFREEYKNIVMNYFYKEYREGRAPNPDILCNSVIKFGIFYEWAMNEGYDFVATGHYAKTDGERLMAAKDMGKDQSYFLYRIKKEQLRHILFPVGDLYKSEVREIAKKENLSVAAKKDSMGICFVGDINVRKFLEEKLGVKKGNVVLSDGMVVGEHDGYWFFTIGYRGGWRRKNKIGSEKLKGDAMPKLYVTSIDKEKNLVTVGTREEAMRGEFELEQINWIDKEEFGGDELYIKVRNTGDLLKAKLEGLDKDRLRVILERKEFGIASGQSGLVYKRNADGYEILGGGVIV